MRRLRTLSCDESSPIGDIVYAFKLLLDKFDSDALYFAAYEWTILSKLRSIFGSDAAAEVFTYFCRHGAATGWEIQCRLNMPEATAYRALKQLRTLGFISPAMKVGKVNPSKGGPRPTVWALEGASQQEVARAYHDAREREIGK